MTNARRSVHTSGEVREIRRIFKEAGLRMTKERELVLSVLMQAHTAVRVEDVFALVKGRVNKVTLYRMLERFATARIVERVMLSDGVKRYEYQEEHHHHITCSECGARKRVSIPEAILARAVCAHTLGFSLVTSHTLEFYGVCVRCADRR